MSSHYPSLLLIPLAVLCSALTYHNTTATGKRVDDIYPGSLSYALMAHLRSRRSPSFPGPPGPPPGQGNAPPECADGCCGRTHVCGLRGCAFKARCGVDCCPPEVVQDLKLRAQRLTLEAAGVPPDGPGGPPHSQNGPPHSQNGQPHSQNGLPHSQTGPRNKGQPPHHQGGPNNGYGQMRSYKKDGDHHHVITVHEKPLSPPQQQLQHLQQQQVNQRQLQQQSRQQSGRNQRGNNNGHVDRQSERIREPPTPPPKITHPGRRSSLPPHPPIDHPHRKAGSMAPHPNTNGPSGLAPSQGAFGPSSRGGFSAAVNERRAVENANSGMQAPPPGRMTFSSKPQHNLRPPPGKSIGPKRPPAFTNRPPSIESPIMRPAAFGSGTSEQENMPFISRVKRCCECCMPDCHHGCIRNGGCGMCQALTGNQNNNNNGITRGARTKQHN